jgi:hypothetical protein
VTDEFEDESEEVSPEWRLWVAKRIGMDGEPFDLWSYEADVGEFHSMRIVGYADEPGTAPKEEDPRWHWTIYWSGGAQNEMLDGDATSRAAAKRDCEDALLQRMRSIFVGTGDLLRGNLPDHLNDALDELDWKPSVGPSTSGKKEDDDRECWSHGLERDEFFLSLELPIDKGTRPIALEVGAWRWWLIDENDTICEGTAPSRTLARQRCVGALLDHLSDICSIVEELRDGDLPSSECTDRERPSLCRHDDERLDPNYVPPKPDHALVVSIMRSVLVGAPTESVLTKVRDLCAETSIEEVRAAIDAHRLNCPLADCRVFSVVEKYVTIRKLVDMSLYNLHHGSDLNAVNFLRALELEPDQLDCFRDASFAKDEGECVLHVLCRTDASNRSVYANTAFTAHPLYLRVRDDAYDALYDATYVHHYFKIPQGVLDELGARGLSLDELTDLTALDDRTEAVLEVIKHSSSEVSLKEDA